jgi:hypothetical protein
MRDDLSHDYATLGLTPSASPVEVRKAYKKLVRQWHPDRFARDPAGQAEATQRMRAINTAYETIRGSYIPRYESTTAADGRVRPRANPGTRLSREQIEELVNSIGREGPVDIVIGTLEWYGRSIRFVVTLLLAAWALARLRGVLLTSGVEGLWKNPDVPLFVLTVIAFAVWVFRDRPPTRSTAPPQTGPSDRTGYGSGGELRGS